MALFFPERSAPAQDYPGVMQIMLPGIPVSDI